MKTIMVRYKTAQEHASTNEALVHAVFDELRAKTPGGLRYACYKLADGVTFVHLATLESAEQNPLVALPAFKAFQKDHKARCVEPPVVTELLAVESY
jgi:quinol monooxygenase YgiN